MKLLDLLNEIEENEATKIEEVETNMVDEIGKFFVVEKPKSKQDTTEDLVFESTMTYFANQIRGGLNEKDIIAEIKEKKSFTRQIGDYKIQSL